MDSLCASGELVWVGAGSSGRSGRVALYFREDAPAIGPPSAGLSARGGAGAAAPSTPEHELIRARLARGPSFFTDLLAELDAPAEALREALWDLVWAGEVTNDAWAPLRAPRLSLARGRSEHRTSVQRRFSGRRRAGGRAGGDQVQGRWSLTDAVFRGGPEGPSCAAERRRTLAELLLERYGIVTREQVLAEGIRGGFAMLYDTFCNLETLGICRRGYFVEGMGGAQFALPGAVERLRAGPGGERDRSSSRPPTPPSPTAPRCRGPGAGGASLARVAPRASPAPTWSWWRTSPCCTSSAAGTAWRRSPAVPPRGQLGGQPRARPTRCARRSPRSPRRSAPGGSGSSRSSASTGSPRSPRASPGRSSSWDSIPGRAG
jgi:hypothetical protein